MSLSIVFYVAVKDNGAWVSWREAKKKRKMVKQLLERQKKQKKGFGLETFKRLLERKKNNREANNKDNNKNNNKDSLFW